ncbi:bifunctional hydroxymethylpyrimidine kinase/phosphomethylpyrimidine kinase [Sphingomonas morindae]|uniref:hydroxymethylpyrimidine kinase n=1 Tax=Sphingomonas morindae TaxID=1541170 RepID=A0ABY4X673_9SPHN|nr:bifunctional hydroxymethylpyrimidine kinase/phosphomethylpyrimidine kinase [Sphingomonas morindae]USI72378.1 bifunctional hydroxymethylpyrimidine kinase/phosphomethylpyrimidine kinase [Sphingomonas morindae]
MSIARVLVIAGSDSGAGAGIQADVKTVMALGGYATTAITAITAQNTRGVSAALALDSALVVAQIDAILSDIGTDSIKIGMLGNAAIAAAVAARLDRPDARRPLVFDPVMVATSGAVLADAATIAAFERLMALATIITPNLPELHALGGSAEALARRSGALVLVKGGHGEGPLLTDRLIGPDGEVAAWSGARIETRHSHGTGCTLASAIATGLAAGLPVEAAVGRARDYVRAALAAAPGLGQGHGPLGHRAGIMTGDYGLANGGIKS